jgi:hypothetical protein
MSRRMHISTIAVAAILMANVAAAQEPPCHSISPTDRVAVTMEDGTSVRGTLLCLSDQAVRLARDGQTIDTPLAGVRRIETRPDRVWDGAVKGAAIPLFLWAVFCHGCEGEGEFFFKSAVTYSLIGLTWDALDTNRKTIYARPSRSASLAWHVRF